jgi:hypothetical protein
MNTVTDQSVLTPSGEQFLADIIQEYQNGGRDYFIQDICYEWGLEHVCKGHMKIPDEYDDYGTITTTNTPLLLKTLFDYPNPTEIRKHPRNAYPRFRNEVFGEICLWNEALCRGKPHTELFAPVFRYDAVNFEWAIVGFATDIQHRNRPATKQVEERGKELGWAPDDTEVGQINDEYVAIDYGFWWRTNDEWITAVDDLLYIDERTYDSGFESPPVPNELSSFERLDDTQPDRHETVSAAHQGTDTSEAMRTRVHRWLSSLFS